MRVLVACLVALSSAAAIASLPLRATLGELARNADHIMVARVVGVDMIDARGVPVSDDSARTGPGLPYTIRLQMRVEEVLVTNAESVPDLLNVPLDPMMHFVLRDVKEAHTRPSAPFLLFLKGASFEPILPGVFARSLDEKSEALRIYAEARGR